MYARCFLHIAHQPRPTYTVPTLPRLVPGKVHCFQSDVCIYIYIYNMHVHHPTLQSALGVYSLQVGSFPNWDVWAEWNGAFRDCLRRFIKGDKGLKGETAKRLCGSADLYQVTSATMMMHMHMHVIHVCSAGILTLTGPCGKLWFLLDRATALPSAAVLRISHSQE